MDIQTVTIDKPEQLNVILGQAHFIKTLEDLYEVLAGSSPQLRFGIAFCESSGPRLVRRAGNDEELTELAVRNARAVGAGHSFVVFLRDGYPLNVLNAIKQVPEVCRVICATANAVQVLVVETELGRGIVGVVDGESPLGVETDIDAARAPRAPPTHRLQALMRSSDSDPALIQNSQWWPVQAPVYASSTRTASRLARRRCSPLVRGFAEPPRVVNSR